MEPRHAFLTDKEAVGYLLERGVKTTAATMKNQRSYGKWGLKFYRVAGRVYYTAGDIDEWLNQSRFAEGGRRCPRLVTPPAPPGEDPGARSAPTAAAMGGERSNQSASQRSAPA
jgi:hypothetical protein